MYVYVFYLLTFNFSPSFVLCFPPNPRLILFTIFQECELEISQKGDLVAKLETKTKEISQMLNNLNTMAEKEKGEKL